MANSNTFILSDDSINSHGFKILTSGIKLDDFLKNPIMLYMHERRTVIGRWENVRIEDNKLLGDPIFNENTALGLSIKKQVLTGFLRAVSIGVDNAKYEQIDGVETVISCTLTEVSIVDVPANPNAVKLTKNGKSLQITKVLPNQENDENDILKEIKELLRLNESSTLKDVLEAIKTLKNEQKEPKENIPEVVEQAHSLKLIKNVDLERFSKSDKNNKTFFVDYCEKLVKTHEKNVENEVERLLNSGKILNSEKDVFKSVAKKIGLEDFKRLALCIPGDIRLVDALHGGKDYNQERWGLKEYRKYKPQELAENPELYRMLLEKEGQSNNESLDWLRKNNPEYLKDNPHKYKELVDRKNG